MTTYYIERNGEQRGPYSMGQLEQMWAAGSITADSNYWTQGMVQWASITDLLDKRAPQIHSPDRPQLAPAATRSSPISGKARKTKPSTIVIGCLFGAFILWRSCSSP